MKQQGQIGGEIKGDYKEWIETVNLENSNCIEYGDFRPIYNFLNEKLQIKLNQSIQLLKKNIKKE